MACGPNPRQPRSGCASNFAESRYVRQTGLYDVTVGSTCSGTSAVVARMRNGDRARQLVARLNDVFGSPRADLDFITPGIGSDPFASNQYAVIWSQVTWYPDCSQYTDTNDGRTYELVYTGYNDKSKVTTLITITAADVDLYGKPRWRIALDWANIFHTNDLTVAVRSDLSFLDDKWVRISYGGKSVVARATDRAGQHTQIDLSAGGVAHYLGFPGSGTVSYGPP